MSALLLLLHIHRYELYGQTYTAGARGALLLVSTSRDESTCGSEHGENGTNVDLVASPTSAGGEQGRGRYSGQQQEQRFECLSSAIPLHNTGAPGIQQDQDAV